MGWLASLGGALLVGLGPTEAFATLLHTSGRGRIRKQLRFSSRGTDEVLAEYAARRGDIGSEPS